MNPGLHPILSAGTSECRRPENTIAVLHVRILDIMEYYKFFSRDVHR
jgi:hypothetical protein